MAQSRSLILFVAKVAALALLYDAEAYIIRGSLNINGLTAVLNNHRDIYSRLYGNGVDLKEDILFLVPRTELFNGGEQSLEANYNGHTNAEREIRDVEITKYATMPSRTSQRDPEETKDKEESFSEKYPEIRIPKRILGNERHYNSERSPNYVWNTRIPDNPVYKQ